MSARQNPVAVQKSRSAASDDLSNRVAESGMISSGAHPEFDVETPLDKVSKIATNVGDWLNKHFGTKHTPAPTPKQGPIQMSAAEEDSLSKKYLGR